MEKGERAKYFQENVIPVLQKTNWGEWKFEVEGDDSSWWFVIRNGNHVIFCNPFWEEEDGIPVDVYRIRDPNRIDMYMLKSSVLPYDVSGDVLEDAVLYKRTMVEFIKNFKF